jgi:hypothetical protein
LIGMRPWRWFGGLARLSLGGRLWVFGAGGR